MQIGQDMGKSTTAATGLSRSSKIRVLIGVTSLLMVGLVGASIGAGFVVNEGIIGFPRNREGGDVGERLGDPRKDLALQNNSLSRPITNKRQRKLVAAAAKSKKSLLTKIDPAILKEIRLIDLLPILNITTPLTFIEKYVFPTRRDTQSWYRDEREFSNGKAIVILKNGSMKNVDEADVINAEIAGGRYTGSLIILQDGTVRIKNGFLKIQRLTEKIEIEYRNGKATSLTVNNFNLSKYRLSGTAGLVEVTETIRGKMSIKLKIDNFLGRATINTTFVSHIITNITEMFLKKRVLA